ncbi:MAG: hypothetical protein AMXMBFR59_16700 [Rhodanobacteraceae bacterium]
MTAEAKRRRRQKGRQTTEPFASIPIHMLRHPKFLRLSPYAKALFLYWAGLYNGINNGDFSAANNRFREFGFRSPATLQKAKRALVEQGFAVMTRQGEKRRCSLYGLTIWPIDECGGKLDYPAEKRPSHAWKRMDAGCPIGKTARVSN